MKKNDNTEQQILQAAEELFLEKGYNATSTTDIARHIGCNQSLIHYYFRTKDALFERILFSKLAYVMQSLSMPLNTDMPFEDKLRHIVEWYFDFLSTNRYLPLYLINEVVTNEKNRCLAITRYREQIQGTEYFVIFDHYVQREVNSGNIRPIATLDLMIDIISLVACSILSAPLCCDLFGNPDGAESYLVARRIEVCTLLINGLRRA